MKGTDLISELERYKQALQRANGFLIMHNLEPVKLEYPQQNECICPTCGLRHGGSNVDGGF